MRGAQRVITFCLLTAVLPTILLIIPLYLRHIVYADVTFSVAESDVVEIEDGISSIFCQEHSLKMSTPFQAFQIDGKPQLSETRKHIRLKKSMSLPDDTLEYWGFYLLKGSTVGLSVCSRYDGSRILVVKGERNLRTCGLMDHSMKPLPPHMANGEGQVRVTFETEAQVVHSESIHTVKQHSTKSVNHHAKKSINKSRNLFSNADAETNVSNEQYEGEIASAEKTYVDKNIHELNESKAVNHGIPNNSSIKVTNESVADIIPTKSNSTRKLRHARYRLKDLANRTDKSDIDDVGSVKETSRIVRTKLLQESLKQSYDSDNLRKVNRVKRRDSFVLQGHILDGGIGHGHGGANDSLKDNTESSVSSFENSLLNCYDGQILLVQGFPPSPNCTSVQDVEGSHIMKTSHEVVSDGYYYYIFYSDNDVVENDIHAIFNIRKPTYQYANHSRGCINKTECTFPISFWSEETVIVEVPTRDGIEHEDDDITFLVSSCYPRMSVYIIFPILVLFLILGCAFL